MTTLEGQRSTLSLLIFLLVCSLSNAFQSYQPSGGSIGHKSQEIRLPRTFLFATPDDKDSRTATTTTSGVEEYKNVATKVLSNFMQKDKMDEADMTNPIDDIDFDSGMKIPSSTSLEDLAQALDCELIEKEWFVTGKVRKQKRLLREKKKMRPNITKTYQRIRKKDNKTWISII